MLLEDLNLRLVFLGIIIVMFNVLGPLMHISTRPLTFILPKRIILDTSAERWHDNCLNILWVVLTHRSTLELLVMDLSPFISGDCSDHARFLTFELV
jgi:hypothetical protein